jgi:hypothetical protein
MSAPDASFGFVDPEHPMVAAAPDFVLDASDEWACERCGSWHGAVTGLLDGMSLRNICGCGVIVERVPAVISENPT